MLDSWILNECWLLDIECFVLYLYTIITIPELIRSILLILK
jgi:hypothetical protein